MYLSEEHVTEINGSCIQYLRGRLWTKKRNAAFDSVSVDETLITGHRHFELIHACNSDSNCRKCMAFSGIRAGVEDNATTC